MKVKFLLSVVVLACVMSGCAHYVPVPPGFKGIALTPSGYEGEFKSSGLIDIGAVPANGGANQAVLVETTSKLFYEQFRKQVADGGVIEDHRCESNDGVKLGVDGRVRVYLPEDDQELKKVLARITPKKFVQSELPTVHITNDADRVLVITMEMIYKELGRDFIRESFRDEFDTYADYKAAKAAGRAELGTKVGGRATKKYEENDCPLRLASVSISDIKEDNIIFEANAAKAAAVSQREALEEIGEVLQRFPGLGPSYQLMIARDIVKERADRTPVILMIGGNPQLAAEAVPLAQALPLQQPNQEVTGTVQAEVQSETQVPKQ